MKNTEERAREIVIKMQFQKEPIMFEQAKQCALIAVNFVISANPHSNPFNNDIVFSTMAYWQEVKSEIEKL